ncbi:hypothetical protein [Streptomyces sp. HNM0574]|uniref:hypothetical protein n=1 Tax=Streptomyces sp. HNM0574 TaxID=2714954 RepID=UPI00146B956D|nr:hypothetical protein [Streptomyces sp. HNM0574]NLU70478.1 hypothetical protein [Streptomyces sp. HNM0574]
MRVTAWRVAMAVVVLVAAAFVTQRLDLWHTESAKRAEDVAEKAIDAEEAPFTAHVSRFREDTSMVQAGRYVLDRPLTAAERQKAASFAIDTTEMDTFLRSIGARRLGDPSKIPHNVDTPPYADASSFNLQLHSSRKSTLTITDLRAKVLRCNPSRARAVFERHPEGEAAYTGVLYDLTKEGSAAVTTQATGRETEELGQPFFRNNVINLGGGEEPANLRVESLTSGRSCAWELLATYSDETGTHTRAIRDSGKPFFTEAAPVSPDQYWVAAMTDTEDGEWADCATGKPSSDVVKYTCEGSRRQN